jgi:flagellar protein FliS
MVGYTKDQYVKTQVETADRGRLIVLLYEGAIKFLRKAQEGIEEKNIEKRCNNIDRALNIIDELKNSLNISQGGEIAIYLIHLYLFMRGHLVSANIKNDSKMIQDVIKMLTGLKEAWETIVSKPERKEPSTQPTPRFTGVQI